jgi:hypothetical protein
VRQCSSGIGSDSGSGSDFSYALQLRC